MARAAPIAPAAAALVACAAGGALAAVLHVPLPWMVGPLVAMAVLKLAGLALVAPPLAREGGQIIIATALGLYFTPAVARETLAQWWILVLAATFAMALGYAGGWVLARFAGLDRTTGLFASIPGGATEMAVLAERFGGKPDRVALAQSLRILLVVVIIPGALTLSGAHGVDVYQPAEKAWSWTGLAFQFAVAAAGGIAFQWLGLGNAWMLGPLAVTIALTASDVGFSAVPAPLSAAGQLLLGCALGSRFEREFLRSAPRFVAVVTLSILASMAAAALFGALLAWLGGLAAPTMVLATAPGGIAEMAITAKVLQLGVPIVTAAHVLRVMFLVTMSAPVFRALRAMRRRIRS
ncbi:MAG: AbrB family transcriptional regulator [Burkholderiales bacterium]|nr:AbrB family transcriptional regulator [Burkholderiales bacterium]